MAIKREQFLDTSGRPLTQSLFLELGYRDEAIYTLKDHDYEYKGRKLKSIRKVYLETADPTEYQFATENFLSWDHWNRICANKQIAAHINEWREELEVKLRSNAVRMNIAAAQAGNYQAAKWVADRGWTTRAAGRPSKAEVAKNLKIESEIQSEYGADVIRLNAVK